MCVCSIFLSTGLAPLSYAQQPSPFSPHATNLAQYEDALTAYKDGDKILALTYGRQAAHGGDARAQSLIGHILRKGETGLKDVNEAREWYEKAALQNDTDAFVALGEMALESEAGLTPKDAKSWLEKAADLGRHDAMRVLAEMYEKGIGVEQDLEQAQQWRAQAADQGDVLSYRALGNQYLESDPKQALKWFEKAAAHGDPQSAYSAAIMYSENFEIRPNEEKAAILMQQAAKAGLPPAMADYGLLVYQGAGVKRNTVSAAKWFEKSAKAGDAEGQFLYAFTLAKGDGVKQDFEDAYYWLLRSGDSSVDSYNEDRETLKKRLEEHVDKAVLDKARSRFDRTIPREKLPLYK